MPETGLDTRALECGAGGTDSESDLEKLESDVKQMAQRILHYRANLPDQIRSTFASILSAQRPVMPDELEAATGMSTALAREDDVNVAWTSMEGAVLVEEDKEALEKAQNLQNKLHRNISLMPKVLKRMKDSISTTDRLDSCNGTIHDAFKKKKYSLSEFCCMCIFIADSVAGLSWA